MCGIAGEIKFNNSTNTADWNDISARMYRRGPDDSGYWTDNICTMVFRRLSIMDLTTNGHQPMHSENKRFSIVFNGEIYNFKSLRDQLIQKGIKFRSNGDTEVVLYSLIEWGIKALDKFNGMFALGFYDTQEKRLILARDHAGIKPLYYLAKPQGLVFASQYDQIMAHPWCNDLSVCDDALALYFRLSYIPAPMAFYNKTQMLMPGSWIEINAEGKIKQGQYYSFPTYQKADLSGNEAIEAVDVAISDAVKRQMVSDVPLGTFLSGGIDSPLVAAKMKSNSNNRLCAFTIGTGGDETDESEDAAIYAKELGVEHIIEHVTEQQALELIDDVIDASSEPFGDYSLFPTLLVSKLASKDFKVMLSGDGGDELFWGYAKRSASIMNVSERFHQPHLSRKISRKMNKFVPSQNGPPPNWPTIGDWQKNKHDHLPKNLISSIFPGLSSWPESYNGFEYSGYKQDETAQWLRWNEFTCHLPMVLLKVDRASMHQSLEIRVPLLDREVIDIAARVNWESCIDLKSVTGKLPLRAILKRHLNHQTTLKKGFAIPMDRWLRTTLRPMFEELVIEPGNLLGLDMDKKALTRVFNDHVQEKTNYQWGLWPLLSAALWAKKHNIKT